ncbi:hypothetical protein [Rhizobium phage RHph_X2_28B]|nr:hypothetical protein PP751_gp046 [Rhizobium phage RHph_X2_28B]QWY83498.1 hypothetical protein [Rhizobium phage RHph_X2_28B]QWY83734.1 hypothetical protein [Rhizobium phage RHph_X3_15]
MTQYDISLTNRGHWQVKRNDFIMSVFGTRKQAEDYVKLKHEQEQS